MAFNTKPAGVATIKFLDGSGSQASLQLHFPFATLVATVFAQLAALVPLVEAISECKAISYGVSYEAVDVAPSAPADGSRVEEKGLFIFRLANGLSTSLAIPGILDSVLIDTGSIDVTNADVADFLTAVIDSPSVFCGINGSDITAIKAAYQRFRRSTNASLPSDRAKFGA